MVDLVVGDAKYSGIHRRLSRPSVATASRTPLLSAHVRLGSPPRGTPQALVSCEAGLPAKEQDLRQVVVGAGGAGVRGREGGL